jgi:hypothetical protein
MFKKLEVTVREADYTQAEIRKMLNRAAFRLLKTTVNARIEGKPIRLLYLARKV